MRSFIAQLPPFLVVMALASAAPEPSAAQTGLASLATGARVRVTGPAVGGESRAARFLGTHGDTLYLDRVAGRQWGADSVALPVAGVTQLEVSAGVTRNTWLGAGLGTLAGGLIGALTAGDGCTTMAGACATGNAGAARSVDRSASAFSGAVLGALGGGVMGHFWKREHWEALPLSRATSLQGRTPWRLAVARREVAVIMPF